MAYQLKSEEKPKFDNIFIALGAFHVDMALFHAYGQFIAECGGPNILNECLVLPKDLPNHFKQAKMTNAVSTS